MSKIHLIAGLGNPDLEYLPTRHNAGFWMIDTLVKNLNTTWKNESKFFGSLARINISGEDVFLLKPMTYMNLSGKSIAALANFYKINSSDILIIHDELDLSVGVARFKKAGGHGGHNGLKDIISKLGSNDFWRLRIGVDRPEHSADIVNYVLNKPSKDEQTLINMAISNSLDVFSLVFADQMEKAMKLLHTSS